MLQIREQLQRLMKLQDLALRMRAGMEIVERAPARLEQSESHFRERNAEYVVLRERFEAIEADQRRRADELATLEEQHRKYQEDLRRVTNDREYSAVLREIDSVRAHISDHETAILTNGEEAETLKIELDSRAAHIQEERKQVEAEQAKVASETAAAEASIRSLNEERRRIEAELSRNLIGMVQRLEAARNGLFLSRADEGVCQSCHVRIRPQVFQEIRQALAIHTCSNCRRILYHEPSLKAERQASATATVEPPSVEVLNGGSV